MSNHSPPLTSFNNQRRTKIGHPSRLYFVESSAMRPRHFLAALVAGGAVLATLSACAGGTADASLTPRPISSQTTDGLPTSAPVDIQAHRGGRGEYTENTEAAFIHAMSEGTTTIEFDITLSKDGVPMVWNDKRVSAEKCADTQPFAPGDLQNPYVGKRVDVLTFDQLQTHDCSELLDEFPYAEREPGSRMLQLEDVFALAQSSPTIRFNIDARSIAGTADPTENPQAYVDAIVPVVKAFGMSDHVAIQSADWRVLPLVRQRDRSILTVAKYDTETFAQGSPWLAGIQYEAVGGDPITAAASIGADAVAPDFSSFMTQHGNESGPPYEPLDSYVKRAHQHNMLVIPWTVNDPQIMTELINARVDGTITNYPSLLKDILRNHQLSQEK